MAAVGLGFRFLAFIGLPALTGEKLLSPDGGAGTSLQAGQDHVGKVLLEPLEVLPVGNGTVAVWSILRSSVEDLWISYVVGGVGSL